MGLIKSEIFSPQLNNIALYAKALGHPARLAILQQIFDSNACVCGELVNQIGLAQATISQHLKELKQLGLIKGSIEGTSVCYCIDRENWQKMQSMLSEFIHQEIPCNSSCSN